MPGVHELKLFFKKDNFCDASSNDCICITYGQEMETFTNKLCLFYAICCSISSNLEVREETSIKMNSNETVVIQISTSPKLSFVLSKSSDSNHSLKLLSLDETMSFAYDICQAFLYGITRNPLMIVTTVKFIVGEFSENCNFDEWIKKLERFENMDVEGINILRKSSSDIFNDANASDDFVNFVYVQNPNLVIFAKLAAISNFLSNHPSIQESIDIKSLLLQFQQDEVEAIEANLLKKMPKSSFQSGNTQKRNFSAREQHSGTQADGNSEALNSELESSNQGTSDQVYQDIRHFVTKKSLHSTSEVQK